MMRRLLGTAVVALLALAACGEDDGAAVREIGESSGSASGSASGSGSGSGSASGSTAPSGSGSGSGAEAASGCEVVGGTDAAEDGEIHVTLDEWSVDVEETEIAAGVVKVEATNAGEMSHELVIVRGAQDDLPVSDGVVDEEAIPEGDFIGEIEPFAGGEECAGAFELSAGTYTLFCAIVEEHDGESENHYELGMATEIEVG
jgi:hypothetical protein